MMDPDRHFRVTWFEKIVLLAWIVAAVMLLLMLAGETAILDPVWKLF